MASAAGRIRIGHGYDVHRFEPGDAIIIGGVTIAHHQRLAAHSDGDVLLHAVCDALLGALGKGDIGRHFPDDDPANAGIDSRLLLRRVMELADADGWELGNLDATIIAQAPRMGPHVAAMCSHIATDCSVPPGRINVKATTTERLGFAGREEGIAAHAVVLLESRG